MMRMEEKDDTRLYTVGMCVGDISISTRESSETVLSQSPRPNGGVNPRVKRERMESQSARCSLSTIYE